jgi:hypothetical protein
MRAIIMTFLLGCFIYDIGYSEAPEKTQETSNNTLISYKDLEFGNKVIEYAFPFNRAAEPKGKVTLVLRFLPSFHPESQIVIHLNDRNEVAVDYWAATVQLMEVLKSGNNDIEKTTNLMKIRHNRVVVSSEVFNSWFAAFGEALAESTNHLMKRSLSDLLQLDGTEYIVEYYATQGRLSLRLWGSELGVDSLEKDSSIVKWMALILKEVKAVSK